MLKPIYLVCNQVKYCHYVTDFTFWLFFCAGHLTGKHERHFAVSGCPLYHNLSADECKVSSHTQLPVVQDCLALALILLFMSQLCRQISSSVDI